MTTFTKEQVIEILNEALESADRNEDDYNLYGPGICFAKGYVKAAMEIDDNLAELIGGAE